MILDRIASRAPDPNLSRPQFSRHKCGRRWRTDSELEACLSAEAKPQFRRLA